MITHITHRTALGLIRDQIDKDRGCAAGAIHEAEKFEEEARRERERADFYLAEADALEAEALRLEAAEIARPQIEESFQIMLASRAEEREDK